MTSAPKYVPPASETPQPETNDHPARDIASVARRKFIGKVGGAAAAAWTAGVVGLSPLLDSRSTKAAAATVTSRKASGSAGSNNPVSGYARKLASFQARAQLAAVHLAQPVVAQVNNGDEALYSGDYYIGQYTKAMPHDSFGQVTTSAYKLFITACATGKQSDFEKVPLGGTVPQIGPQGGLTFQLEGADTADVTLPPAPALSSSQRAGEMVEAYWHALCRDVPFSSYGTEPLSQAAVADLNNLSNFQGPKINGQVTAQSLFRGFTASDLVGPYLSQLFLMPTGFGLGNMAWDNSAGQPAQIYNRYAPGIDYMTDTTSWLAVQNGQATVPTQSRSLFFAFGNNQFQSTPGYLSDGRDLAGLVHVDELFQHYYWGATAMLAVNFPFNPGNPYSASKTPGEVPFETFNGPHITAAMANAALRAAHAVWYQKYFVHRDIRPEEYAGWVHNTINKLGIGNYNLHSDVLNSAAAQQVFSKYGTYYLPMAYPEGCPNHPSYGSGHATVAGASITILKAFFDTSVSFVSQGVTPVYSPDGVNLVPYNGGDVGQITVGTELDKMASNVALARNTAGMHWRSDYQQSLMLGEAVAIALLSDLVNTFSESNVYFQFTTFSGTPITISKTGVY